MKCQALKLPAPERDELVRALIASIDGVPEDTTEVISRAWDEEIARRIADLESGKTAGIPAEKVFAKIRALIAGHNKR